VPAELLTPAAGLVHTQAGIVAVRAVLADADLDARVPACPGWSLRDLARHLGNVHRWVRGAIVEGHPNTPEADGPPDRAGLLAWYDEGATALVDLLARTDPDTPCWGFGPAPRTARFWFRRQAHEHAVHAHDAQQAVGAAHTIDPDLAVDGIDEVVTMFFPRQVRSRRIEALDRSLAVRAESGARWVVAGDGTQRLTLADAEVTGPAEALYLLLWRRVRLDDPRLTVDGDRSAAEAVLGTAIVP
jgi:uncharacterized protein (TIGR03083 family)